MNMGKLTVTLISFALAGPFAPAEASTEGAFAISALSQVPGSNPPSNSNSSQTTEEQEVLHKKCVQAGDRLDRSVAAMVPGRTWTWQMDSERNREHLDELLRHLKAFRGTDVAFEASLSSEQKSKFNSHLTATSALFQHLERDVQSLDDELRKGYPTRWQVANDVSDMRKEIHHWRKLHQRLLDHLA
jgi:hypothetical protein